SSQLVAAQRSFPRRLKSPPQSELGPAELLLGIEVSSRSNSSTIHVKISVALHVGLKHLCRQNKRQTSESNLALECLHELFDSYWSARSQHFPNEVRQPVA